ncbi:MAG: hypothetical protein ABSA97_09730 [Verrucomicrobiia bacterium]|jgi:hypothetical protein
MNRLLPVRRSFGEGGFDDKLKWLRDAKVLFGEEGENTNVWISASISVHLWLLFPCAIRCKSDSRNTQ